MYEVDSRPNDCGAKITGWSAKALSTLRRSSINVDSSRYNMFKYVSFARPKKTWQANVKQCSDLKSTPNDDPTADSFQSLIANISEPRCSPSKIESWETIAPKHIAAENILEKTTWFRLACLARRWAYFYAYKLHDPRQNLIKWHTKGRFAWYQTALPNGLILVSQVLTCEVDESECDCITWGSRISAIGLLIYMMA